MFKIDDTSLGCNILLKWIYSTEGQSCAILTFGIINFVSFSENRKNTGMKQNYWKIPSCVIRLVYLFKMAPDDQICHIKYLKYKNIKIFKLRIQYSITNNFLTFIFQSLSTFCWNWPVHVCSDFMTLLKYLISEIIPSQKCKMIGTCRRTRGPLIRLGAVKIHSSTCSFLCYFALTHHVFRLTPCV
jgi:hypothetical protein